MKKTVVLFLTATALQLGAQTIGNSPYAAFGIGDVKYDNSVETSGMGGINTAYIWDFNNSFNFKNPAANPNLELTSIRLEATNENNFYNSDYNGADVTKHSTYLSNISLAFPISKKVKFGLGYQPYSSKRYNVLSQTTSADEVVRGNSFRGEGTLNTLQAGLGFQATPELGLGLRSNYYFGTLKDIEEVAFSNAELVNGFESTRKISTFNFTLGSAYQKKYKNDRQFTLGATYTFGNTGQMENTFVNSTYYYAGTEKQGESVIASRTNTDKDMIPQEISAGVGFGHDLRWFGSAQVDYKKGSTSDFLGTPFTYEDAYRFTAGGWYLPNYNNFRNYFSRVIYRYGAFYEKGNLKINDTNINEMGISLGATFPFENTNASSMSGIDLAMELGKRGTTENNLISQSFINVKIGINFADKWFNKTLYD